ncbi:Protein-associating with the carboxyl-terminal domain of ezrin [Chytridiales sp. JEL 0842]|nr:Protein-associating with the carboxyl-terminal domain of ezrin [Chytridiales sp. JEL 0842]
MGATESKLQQSYTLRDVVVQAGANAQTPSGSSSAIGERVPPLYSLHNATHKASGTPVSVFSYNLSSANATQGSSGPVPDKAILENALQRLKTIRHPGIIKYREADIGDTFMYIVTEPVIPLSRILSALSEEEVAMGLYSILKTIKFLHSQSLAHNNIRLDSIFVGGQERRWLLGGMEFLTPFKQIDQSLLTKMRAFMPKDIYCEEDNQENSLPDERDSYSVGRLVQTIVNSVFAAKRAKEEAASNMRISERDLDSSTSLDALFPWYEVKRIADDICSAKPTSRPSAEDLIASPFFSHNPLIFVSETFLREIRTLSNDQKEDGFRKLVDAMRTLPSSTVITYILPKVLSKDLFVEPGVEAFFQDLFMNRSNEEEVVDLQQIHQTTTKSTTLLPKDTYSQYVVPFMMEMIKLRDFDIRVVMLTLFESYAPIMAKNDPEYFQNTLVPEIAAGFEEEAEEICVSTIRAVSYAVPHLFEIESSLEVKQQHQVEAALESKLFVNDGSLASLQIPKSSGSRALSQAQPLQPSHQSMPIISTIPFAHISPASTLIAIDERVPLKPEFLVEKLIIPHILRAVVTPDISDRLLNGALDGVVKMWKTLCCMEAKYKDMRSLVRNLHHCFHLILKASGPERRMHFLSSYLIGDISSTPIEVAVHSGAHNWLPRVMELVIPFLRHSDETFRSFVAVLLTQSITFMSTLPPTEAVSPSSSNTSPTESPTTPTSENDAALVRRLRKACLRIQKKQHIFARPGPKLSGAHKTPAGFSTESLDDRGRSAFLALDIGGLASTRRSTIAGASSFGGRTAADGGNGQQLGLFTSQDSVYADMQAPGDGSVSNLVGKVATTVDVGTWTENSEPQNIGREVDAATTMEDTMSATVVNVATMTEEIALTAAVPDVKANSPTAEKVTVDGSTITVSEPMVEASTSTRETPTDNMDVLKLQPLASEKSTLTDPVHKPLMLDASTLADLRPLFINIATITDPLPNLPSHGPTNSVATITEPKSSILTQAMSPKSTRIEVKSPTLSSSPRVSSTKSPTVQSPHLSKESKARSPSRSEKHGSRSPSPTRVALANVQPSSSDIPQVPTVTVKLAEHAPQLPSKVITHDSPTSTSPPSASPSASQRPSTSSRPPSSRPSSPTRSPSKAYTSTSPFLSSPTPPPKPFVARPSPFTNSTTVTRKRAATMPTSLPATQARNKLPISSQLLQVLELSEPPTSDPGSESELEKDRKGTNDYLQPRERQGSVSSVSSSVSSVCSGTSILLERERRREEMRAKREERMEKIQARKEEKERKKVVVRSPTKVGAVRRKSSLLGSHSVEEPERLLTSVVEQRRGSAISANLRSSLPTLSPTAFSESTSPRPSTVESSSIPVPLAWQEADKWNVIDGSSDQGKLSASASTLLDAVGGIPILSSTNGIKNSARKTSVTWGQVEEREYFVDEAI